MNECCRGGSVDRFRHRNLPKRTEKEVAVDHGGRRLSLDLVYLIVLDRALYCAK